MRRSLKGRNAGAQRAPPAKSQVASLVRYCIAHEKTGHVRRTSRPPRTGPSPARSALREHGARGPLAARSYASTARPHHESRRGGASREASLLEQMLVSVRGATEQTVVDNLDYNARGQRVLCEHANPTTGSTSHSIEY